MDSWTAPRSDCVTATVVPWGGGNHAGLPEVSNLRDGGQSYQKVLIEWDTGGMACRRWLTHSREPNSGGKDAGTLK